MDDEEKAALFGQLAAVQAAIRAVVISHPDPAALLAAFEHERNETAGLLLASDLPDVAIAAFEDALYGMEPHAGP